MPDFDEKKLVLGRRFFFAAAFGTFVCDIGLSRIARAQSPLPFPIVDPKDTVLIEHQDRQRRLVRLANLQGIAPPEFYEYFIPPSEHHLPDFPVNLPVLRVVFRDQVFFDFNSDQLKSEAYAVLNTVAASLRLEPPDVTAFVAGHTDGIGSYDYNLDLGLRRATSVAIALARIGVNRAQVFLVSFGKAVPIASNETEEGRAKNRRVEFLFAARPDPIAAWLARQSATTCSPDASAKGNDCPTELRFRAVSVSIKTTPTSVRPTDGTVPVTLDTKRTNVTATAPTKDVVIGTKVVDIDLRQKVFTIPPPE